MTLPKWGEHLRQPKTSALPQSRDGRALHTHMELFVDEVAGGETAERAFCLERQEPDQMAINWKENKELLVTDMAW